MNFDTLFAKLSNRDKQEVVTDAMNAIRMSMTDLEYKGEYAEYLHRRMRTHQIEAIGKFTLALSCIIFFFIGAPLGAIIRKGGMGVPVIISVLVFIIYYIFENSGMRMARADEWTVWFGKLISTLTLTPVAIFITYKANNDSVVFSVDLYKDLLRRILGLRVKRNIMRKEVIIEDPKYAEDAQQLEEVNMRIAAYSEAHKLIRLPNPIKVFFKIENDHEIEEINDLLEQTIENLGYTRDRLILTELNHYPILMTRAHTRPFNRKWLNIAMVVLLPLGVFLYLRMCRFRLRLYKDLHAIRQTSDKIIPKALELSRAYKINKV
jgi:lipopolysaccharide export system permease protein